MRTVFETEGDIRGTDLLAGLVALWRQGSSGSLHFSRPGATAAFQLAAGEIVGVSASDSRFETASILVRAGKLDASTLERLPAPDDGDRAFAAMQAGILTKREWRWGEKIRAVEVLSDLLTWIEGDYVFDVDAAPEPGEFRLTVPRLVLELFLRSRDRGLVLHHLGGADVPLVRAARFDEEFAIFGLTSDAEAVVSLIDGKATAADISTEGPADAFAVEKLLAALVTLGLVHPAFAHVESAPAPEPPAQVSEESPAADEPEEEREVELEPQEAAVAGDEPEEAEEAEEEEEEDDEGASAEPYSEIEEGESEDRPKEIDGTESAVGHLEIRGAADEPAEEPPHSGPTEWDRGSPDREPELTPRDPVEGRGSMLDLDGPRDGSYPAFEKPLDMATGIGSEDRPGPRRAPLMWLLAILVAGVAAVVMFRSRGGAPGPKMAPVATPTGVDVAVAAPQETSTPLPLSAVAATEVPTIAPPAPTRGRPTPIRPRPAPTRAAAPPAAAAPGAAASREPAGDGSRQSWLDRAARDQHRAAADHKAHYTIQLELACEIGSLTDAWKYDRPAGTMWVLSTSFQGKTCFRVLWGRYPSRDAAHRALASVPGFFTTARNRPVVTGIR